MKYSIKNMIDCDSVAQMRNSDNMKFVNLEKNDLLRLTPLEYYKNSAKVLLNDKIFIAQIDGNIPLKEELIAIVLEVNPFTLSLKFSDYFQRNHNLVIDQIIDIFKIINSNRNRELLSSIINEELPLIKSKIIHLEKLTKKIKCNGLELSLLINLVWKYSEKELPIISELYENLFALSFTNVIKKLFDSIKVLLLEQEDNYLLNEINNNLIYDEKVENINSLKSKSEAIIKLTKYLINTKLSLKNIDEFILYGSMYVLQKSVLKDYDYYPDFVIVKKGSELSTIKYNIKKLFLRDGSPSLKIEFAYDKLPIKLKGYFRNNFLLGNIDSEDYESNKLLNEIEQFKNNLASKWQINSDLQISENEIFTLENSIRKHGLNKLVS